MGVKAIFKFDNGKCNLMSSYKDAVVVFVAIF
jgi:hypothetical protein